MPKRVRNDKRERLSNDVFLVAYFPYNTLFFNFYSNVKDYFKHLSIVFVGWSFCTETHRRRLDGQVEPRSTIIDNCVACEL